MTATTNLQLPRMEAAQAQKHVTYNETLRRLDALVQLMVLDRDLNAPPASPTDGQRWLVGPTPSGIWAGKAGQIAHWVDGAWEFLPANEGWLAWVADEDRLYRHDGATWAPLSPYTEEGNFTPSVTGIGGGSGSGGTRNGTYLRVGRLVHVSMELINVGKGTIAGELAVSLPFTVASGARWPNLTMRHSGLQTLTGTTRTIPYASPNTALVLFQMYGKDSFLGTLGDAQLTTSFSLWSISGTYIAA